jgi:hypothetical protein
VIGDSPSHGLASELKNCLGHEYSISGTIIPGARLTHLCQRLQFFEFVHDIHICYLEKFKKQEFEEKFFLLYSIVEL